MGGSDGSYHGPAYLPTPSEIRAACQACQACREDRGRGSTNGGKHADGAKDGRRREKAASMRRRGVDKGD